LHGYKLGAVDYLFLPIVPDVLKAKVKAFVELARQTQVIRRQAERLAYHNQQQARQIELIQQLNRTLTAANHELESFSYTISHDLRAPLRALKGYSEFLVESCCGNGNQTVFDEAALDCIKRIHLAAVCMDNLTNDLLQYSHIARERIELAPVFLEDVVQELVRMNLALQAPAAEVSTSPALEPVLAHRSLLLHCLENLTSNAIKFVAPGIKPRVHIRTARVGEKIRICVDDNGIGIDPVHHKRIFGLFERVGDVRRYEGTGVGLAIVARAAERMGGSCGLDSKPNVGSSFWIELPAAPITSASPNPASAPKTQHTLIIQKMPL
jgi:signal transduction histidine kinase